MQPTFTETTSTNPASDEVVPNVTVQIGSVKKTLVSRVVDAGRDFDELSKDLDAEEKQDLAESLKNQAIEETIAQDAADVVAVANRLADQQGNSITQYVSPAKVEHSWEIDDTNIPAHTRHEYVWLFKAQQRRTAVAALDMCRVVYEAQQILSDHEFNEFCKNIGYKEDSSTIRKFLAIGKVYPRMIKYADQLPAAWTSIYALTQMPADDFERCVANGYRLCDLTGGEVDDLVKKTRAINNSVSPFKLDKKTMSFCVANVFFTKQVDDADFRLLQKAFDEIATRLPIKLVIKKEATEYFEKRRNQRYEKLKQEAPGTAVDPSKWDYGTAANAVNSKDAT